MIDRKQKTANSLSPFLFLSLSLAAPSRTPFLSRARYETTEAQQLERGPSTSEAKNKHKKRTCFFRKKNNRHRKNERKKISVIGVSLERRRNRKKTSDRKFSLFYHSPLFPLSFFSGSTFSLSLSLFPLPRAHLPVSTSKMLASRSSSVAARPAVLAGRRGVAPRAAAVARPAIAAAADLSSSSKLKSKPLAPSAVRVSKLAPAPALTVARRPVCTRAASDPLER